MNDLVSKSYGEFRGWVSSSQDASSKTFRCASLEDAIESSRKKGMAHHKLSSAEL